MDDREVIIKALNKLDDDKIEVLKNIINKLNNGDLQISTLILI